MTYKTMERWGLGGHFIKLKKGKKDPAGLEWQLKKADSDKAYTWLENGYNVGFVLGPRIAVVDIDPRSGGAEGFDELWQKGIDLDNLRAFVVSSRGTNADEPGAHYYFELPQGEKIRTMDKAFKKAFPGVEIYSGLHFMVAPGSFVAGSYDCEKSRKKLPLLPEFFLKSRAETNKYLDIRIGMTPDGIASRQHAENIFRSLEQIGAEDLRKVLSLLKATDFASNDLWLPIAMACHSATGGESEAREVFVEWSTKDPFYCDHEEKIRKRWDSMSVGEGGVTIKSLRQALKDAGEAWPLEKPVKVVAKEPEEMPLGASVTMEGKGHLTASSEMEELLSFWTEDIIESDKLAGFIPVKELKLLINTIDQDTTPKDIEKIIAGIANIESIVEADMLITETAKAYGSRATVIGKAVKAHKLKARSMGEADKWHKAVMKRVFCGGRFLWGDPTTGIHWRYDGKKWSILTESALENTVVNYVRSHLSISQRSEIDIAALLTPICRLIRADSIRREDLHDAESAKSIFNMLNGELHFESRTGKSEFKPFHDPESRLTSLIKAKYDPKAKAPKFSKYLDDVFANERDPQAVKKLCLESMAYAAQAEKNIAAIIMLHGTGSNGKTVLLKVLNALLQEASIFGSLEALEDDKFALYTLVGKTCFIDEDVSSRNKLPDGILKKISEHKPQTIRKMHHEGYQSYLHITPILACNGFPKTSDTSVGLMRRIVVIPFSRRFTEKEANTFLAQEIIDEELPGVLNMLAEALLAVKQRGYIVKPESSMVALARWQRSASFTLSFCQDMLVEDKNISLDSVKLYNAYLAYCAENAFRTTATKRQLLDDLEALGEYTIDGERIKGITLASLAQRNKKVLN